MCVWESKPHFLFSLLKSPTTQWKQLSVRQQQTVSEMNSERLIHNALMLLFSQVHKEVRGWCLEGFRCYSFGSLKKTVHDMLL